MIHPLISYLNLSLNLNRSVCAVTLAVLALAGARAAPGPGAWTPPVSTVPSPRDVPFTGTMSLEVDLTDTVRRIVTVKQRIPVQRAGDVVLLYPRWESATHAPSVEVHRLTGLRIRSEGRPLPWRRDPIDVHAFRVQVPRGAATLDLDFQYVAPVGREPTATITRDFIDLSWNRVLLYPAGWYARRIPVQATVTLPQGFQHASAIPGALEGRTLRLAPSPLDQLIDAPLFAAPHVVRRAIAAGPATVTAHWMAAQADTVAKAATFDEPLRAVVRETAAVFGPPPFKRYDFLFGLDDLLPGPGGIEHATSGELFLPTNFLSDAEGRQPAIDVIPHELIHAWNGAWRMPADLWTPTPHHPQQGSLLWMYEGQTEFWARVIGARSGLRDRQDTLDAIAIDAAMVERRAGRAWKSLADSTNDPVVQKRAVYWRDWQGREDYYVEGVLFWLDIDAQLRERSQGAKGLDDFAAIFFSTARRTVLEQQRLYTERDIVDTLSRIAPGDWAGIVRRKLDSHDHAQVLDGLRRHGWRLVYRDTPTRYFRLFEDSMGVTDLTWSIGLTVRPNGVVRAVTWEGPAFRAGIVPGARLTGVGELTFDAGVLKGAITQAARGTPLKLRFTVDGREQTVEVDAGAGLRYPVLERIDGTKDGLVPLLAPRSSKP